MRRYIAITRKSATQCAKKIAKLAVISYDDFLHSNTVTYYNSQWKLFSEM